MFAPTTFRQQFPEFRDPAQYSDAVLEFWAEVAGSLVGERWGDLRDYGVSLVVAHHLVIAFRNQESAAAGGNVGEAKGPLASRTVGDVTNTWHSSAVTEQGAGFWNATTYGQQYIRLARMMGAGGMQL